MNNAGIAGDQRPPGEATIEDLRTVFETNVFGAAAVIDACTPLLEASAAPVVVNVSSAVGSLGAERVAGLAVDDARLPDVEGGAEHADPPVRAGVPPLAGELGDAGAHR